MRIVLLSLFGLAFVSFLPAQPQVQPGCAALRETWADSALPDTTRMQALNSMIWDCFLYSQPDSACYYNTVLHAFASNSRSGTYLAHVLSNEGALCQNRRDYRCALEQYARSYQLYTRQHNERGAAVALSNTGMVYDLMENWEKATESNFAALKIFEKIGHTYGEIASLNNLAATYGKQHMYDKAMLCARKALALSEKGQDKRAIAISLFNVSRMHRWAGEFAQALPLLERSLDLRREINDRGGMAVTLHSISEVFTEQEKYREALPFVRRSLALYRTLKDTNGMALCYGTLAVVFTQAENYPQAVTYAEKALGLCRAGHLLNLTRINASLLSELYQETGNDRKALEMYKVAVAARDSLRNDEARIALNREQLRYEYEKQALLDSAAHQRNLLQQQAQSDREQAGKNILLTLLSALLLLLLLAGFSYFSLMRQKNTIAIQKNNLLKQKLLVSQINPHFIFNSLNAIQNLIFRQDSFRAGTYLSQFADLMRMILELSREDFIPVAAEERFLRAYLDLQQLRFNTRFTYTIEIDEAIDPDDTFIPPMLAQPFVENAIEHGILPLNAPGHIHLRLFRTGNCLCYEISDNGIGLEAAKNRKISLKTTHKSLATIITRERMAVLHKNSSAADIQILDKHQLAPGDPGVLVRFSIPFLDHFPQP